MEPLFELKEIFRRLGLEVPDKELVEVQAAVKYIDEMKIEVRKHRETLPLPIVFPESSC